MFGQGSAFERRGGCAVVAAVDAVRTARSRAARVDGAYVRA